MSRMHRGAAVAVATLALAATASAATVHKSDTHANTINLVEAHKELQPTLVDTGTPGPSVGDLAIARDEVLFENGSPAGTSQQTCTLVDVASSPFTSTFECAGSIALHDGTITTEGSFVPSTPEQDGAIAAGTGAYKTARGEVVIRAKADQIIVKLAR